MWCNGDGFEGPKEWLRTGIDFIHGGFEKSNFLIQRNDESTKN